MITEKKITVILRAVGSFRHPLVKVAAARSSKVSNNVAVLAFLVDDPDFASYTILDLGVFGGCDEDSIRKLGRQTAKHLAAKLTKEQANQAVAPSGTTEG